MRRISYRVTLKCIVERVLPTAFDVWLTAVLRSKDAQLIILWEKHLKNWYASIDIVAHR